jgi:hypothetical protein
MLILYTAGSQEDRECTRTPVTARFPEILIVALWEASEEWWRVTQPLKAPLVGSTTSEHTKSTRGQAVWEVLHQLLDSLTKDLLPTGSDSVTLHPLTRHHADQ